MSSHTMSSLLSKKKRLALMAVGGLASAALFAGLAPSDASAETNRRLCGGKVTETNTPDGVVQFYYAVKVQKGDTPACQKAITEAGEKILGDGLDGFPVGELTCEEVFADLGHPEGTDGCPNLQVKAGPEDITTPNDISVIARFTG